MSKPTDLKTLSTEEKRKLLAKMLQKKATQKVAQKIEVHPPSYGQQSLWYIYQNNPLSAAYNLAIPLRICTTLDIPALQQTWQTLINRYPILRTTYSMDNNALKQHIHPFYKVDIEEIDASTWREVQLKQEVIADYKRPFNLEQGPIIRATLFISGTKDYLLLLTVHHIAFDSMSIGILLEDLQKLYEIEKSGKTASLPPLSASYIDYVYWEKKLLEGEDGTRLANYWQKQLDGNLLPLNLPTDRPRPSVQTYNGDSISIQLAPKLTRQLRLLAQSKATTPYTLLLATFQLLLYRYTGQKDILIGCPTFAGRNQTQFAKIIGYLVNPTVLRTKIPTQSSLPFSIFLNKVHKTVLDAIKHQDYPFTLLVKQLHLDRDLSYTPVFQVVFNFHDPRANITEETSDKPQLFSLFEIPQMEGQFDLVLDMVDQKQVFGGDFKYNADLFKRSTITRLANHFKILLEAIINNPDCPILELEMLTKKERQLLLEDWNNTAKPYPQNICLHQLFEQQVEKTPQAIAVVFENQTLTYQQLNQKANQLAHYLIDQGVRPNTLVGLCVQRSLEMIIGLLAILKAGGAYLPFDPTYPKERLALILKDAQVSLLLTQHSLKNISAKLNGNIIYLDSDWVNIAQYSIKTPKVSVTPNHLAYVIYTSGSTGIPKGVQIDHKAVLNLITWHQTAFNISSKDKATQVASLAFDAAVWEIWPYLANGSSIYIANDQQRNIPLILQQWLLTNKITVTFVPTPLAELMLNLSWPSKSSLRLLLTGGDKLSRYPHKVPFKLINNYGPTENTVVSTSGVVNEQTNFQSHPAIGYPINNTKLYILDKDLNLTPVGTPGELHITSVGLSWGYLNRPSLTAEKFIPNPFNQKSEKEDRILYPNTQTLNALSRLYKTGDLARYLPDGNIEFLGRIDNQVKIRGFRVELGEIQTYLTKHPDIKEGIVIAIQPNNKSSNRDIKSDKQLVAYIIPKKEKKIPTSEELANFLMESLPNYMIPTAYIVVDKFPLTPNGKLDRKALQDAKNQLATEFVYVAPQTEIERQIAALWQDLLGVEQVGVNDGFFELGGHSLLLAQLHTNLQTQFNKQVSLIQLFEHSTVKKMATLFSETVEQTNNKTGESRAEQRKALREKRKRNTRLNRKKD